MTVVVDLGCYSHPAHQGQSQDSVARLIEMYHPTHVYGFDPLLSPPAIARTVNGTRITLYPVVAWTHNGRVPFTRNAHSPLASCVEGGPRWEPCLDFAAILRTIGCAVVKMDVQGAEYRILEHLIEAGAIELVDELLIEWHPIEGWEARKAAILDRLTCPVREWSM